MEGALGASRVAITSAFSLGLAASALCALPVGRWLDRHGPRSSIAEIFGARHYGAISGAVALGAHGARAVGPVGASLLVVALGSYERVFWGSPRRCWSSAWPSS